MLPWRRRSALPVPIKRRRAESFVKQLIDITKGSNMNFVKPLCRALNLIPPHDHVKNRDLILPTLLKSCFKEGRLLRTLMNREDRGCGLAWYDGCYGEGSESSVAGERAT